MAVITTKFAGSCYCGAHVPAGSRANWSKSAGIQACGSCSSQVIVKAPVTVNGVDYTVAIRGRNGKVTGAGVSVNTMELYGRGAIHFNAAGEVTGIGASSSFARADLCDYIAGAKLAARQLAIEHGLRK